MSTNPTEAPNSAPPSNSFFTWMRGLGITREPGWLGGVAAGVAARFGIDPILVRGIFIVVALIGAPALLLYAAAWLLLPDLEGRIHLERLVRGHFDGAVIGIGVVLILAFLPVTQGLWFWGPWNWDVWGGGRFLGGALWNAIWTLAIIGAIVWLIVWLSTRNGTTKTPHDSVLYTAPSASTTWATDAAGSSSASPSSTATDGSSATFVAGAGAPVPPPATPPADPDALEEWKAQQAEWKREHDAWKAQQAQAERERSAQERRIRAEQAATQRAALAEEYRRTRSHPLFSLVAIGLALVAGAASALVLVGTGPWTQTATQVGLAVTLGMLGLAVVINGLMGKRQGGAGGMAWLVAFALLLTSWGGFGGIGSVSITGDRDWSLRYVDDRSVTQTHIAGDVNLDLSDYFDGAPAATQNTEGRVTLRVVSGDANVVVPANARTRVHVSVVSGTIRSEESGTDDVLRSTHMLFGPRPGSLGEHTLLVNVWIVAGDVSVTQATNN